MNLYRITKTKYAHDLNGTGGLYGPGRWHREGTRILYFAEHVSLAMLEVLANSPHLPNNTSLITIEIPDTATVLTVEKNTLPADWNLIPAPPTLADFTEQWLTDKKFWLMRVPSVHSPTEFNYLLNPLHPEHQMLTIASIEPHSFDPRLKQTHPLTRLR